MPKVIVGICGHGSMQLYVRTRVFGKSLFKPLDTGLVYCPKCGIVPEGIYIKMRDRKKK